MTAGELADHPIATHLKDIGISKALIIDDAYDAPTRETHAAAIPDFWATVSHQPALLDELKTVRPDIDDQDQIDDQVLRLLWERRDALEKLGPILKSDLFSLKIGDLTTLNRLTQHLKEVGIEAVSLGSDVDLPAEPINLVFLDYHLGPGTGAVELSTSKARKIYETAPGEGNKPFIVLMSSQPDVAKDVFREASGLLAGLFGYVTKSDLLDKENLFFHLGTWAFDMPKRHEIQHFVEALGKAAAEASIDFTRRIKALGLEDYANIQHLSLRPDGHPFGDYMLWLYKSLFAHLLHAAPQVIVQQKQLDKWTIDTFTPSEHGPSLSLAEIYRCAITEPGVDVVGPHPRAEASDPNPLLRLGDLFFKEQSSDVLIVINAACDLAYAPGTQREFPGDLAILLVQGRLQPFEEQIAAGATRTELFEFHGKAYRIVWDETKLIAKKYSEVSQWLTDGKYARKARLALPYALQIQQAFATNLMRIGMPTTPPYFQPAGVEVYCGDQTGKPVLLESIPMGAVVYMHGGKSEFFLTVDCMKKVVSKLPAAIGHCQGHQAGLTAESAALDPSQTEPKKVITGRISGLKSKLEKLEKLKSLSQVWVPLVRKLHALPIPQGNGELSKKLLRVYRDVRFDVEFPEAVPIALNLRLPERGPNPAPPEHAGQPQSLEGSSGESVEPASAQPGVS